MYFKIIEVLKLLIIISKVKIYFLLPKSFSKGTSYKYNFYVKLT